MSHACGLCGRRFLDPLTRIEHKLDHLIEKEIQFMSDTDDKLTQLETDEAAEAASLTALDADEQRELADLAALKASQGGLTPEEQARFDALDQKLQADKARIDAEDAAIVAADPAPPAPAA